MYDLFSIKHPIIQGNKAHIITAGTSSAVSNVGAPGIIGCIIFQLFDIDIPLNSPYAKEAIKIIPPQ